MVHGFRTRLTNSQSNLRFYRRLVTLSCCKRYSPHHASGDCLSVKTADVLSNLNFVMPSGSAQDVPREAGELHWFESVGQNTEKYIFSA